MSSRPRYFVISADRFDGTTSFNPALLAPVTLNGNGVALALPSSQEPRLWADIDGVVGRFSFASLLRPGNLGALIRVRTITPAEAGGIWQFRSASSTEETEPPGINQALSPTRNLSQEWSAPFEAGPTDALAVTHLPDSEEKPCIEIEVTELGGDVQIAWLAATATPSAAADTCCNFDSVTMTATGTVPSYNGTLLVVLTPAADAVITLPDSTTVDVGSKVVLVRESGAGIPTIEPTAGDEINGSTTAEDTRYFMRNLQDSVEYIRVPSGWRREQGTGVGAVQVGGNPINVRAQYEGTQYVISTVVGASVQLPDAADCRQGYRVVIFNAATGTEVLVDSGAVGTETIDGQTTAAVPFSVPPRGVVILELVDNVNTRWMTVSSDPSPAPLSSAVNIALTAWRSIGTQIVTMTAAGTVTLPPITDLSPRARVLVVNTSAGQVVIDGDGADQINGAANRTVWQGQACLLTTNGTIWLAVGGVNQPANIVSAADPTPVAAWVDNPQYVETTGAAGQTVQLPSAAVVAQGATLIHFNSTAAAAHEIAPSGAELINGLNAVFPVAAGERVIVTRVSATEWIAVLSA